MREIKFRYVFRRKEDGHIWMLIVPIEAIEDGSGQLATMLSNELWELISRDQFTGLKDKNGVEIYEGDILATSNNNPEYDIWRMEDYGFTVVIWDDAHAMFRGSVWSWSCDDDESVYRLSEFVEIIGNPHENRDLLK